jgi:hypothetical protein
MSFFHCVWISREIAPVRSDSVIVSACPPRRFQPSGWHIAEGIEQRARRGGRAAASAELGSYHDARRTSWFAGSA